MTITEATAAKKAGVPVVLRYKTGGKGEYRCILKLYRRKDAKGKVEYCALLDDKCGHSTMFCDIADVSLSDTADQQPKITGQLRYDPYDNLYTIIYDAADNPAGAVNSDDDITLYSLEQSQSDSKSISLRGGQALEVYIEGQWQHTQLEYNDDIEAWCLTGIEQSDIEGLQVRITQQLT